MRERRKPWKPTDEEKERAYQEGLDPDSTDVSIAQAIGVRLGAYRKYKGVFTQYSNMRKGKRTKREKVRGAGAPRGSRLLTYAVRQGLINLVENNFTYQQCADHYGFAVQTLKSWLTKYPKFGKQIALARTVAALSVKNSVKRRANGCYTKDTQVTELYGANGQLISTQRTYRKKEHAPDVNAQKFYLQNQDNWTTESKPNISNHKGAILEAVELITKPDKKEEKTFTDWDKELD